MLLKPYYEDNWVVLYHGNSQEIVPHLPKVDLLLTDPPYGIGESKGRNANRFRRCKFKLNGIRTKNYGTVKDYGADDWDNQTIDQTFIDTLIKQPAIIFGGNYYAMPPSTCWLVWDKQNTGDFADCELAWTNLPGAVRKIEYLWNGVCKKRPEKRYHPTQKPLDVMKWCIMQADTKLKKQTQIILDPFAGSGTTLRAAKDMNRKAIGIEQLEKYCEIAAKRLSQEVLNFT